MVDPLHTNSKLHLVQERVMLRGMQHLLRSKDLSREQIEALFDRAKRFLPIVEERKSLKEAEGKILAALFYEPSTRTRFSFETAMMRLGGSVISNPMMMSTSSHKKGETLYDTAQMVSRFANIIAIRHPESGSVVKFAKGSLVPVINGGDGPADHPTQGLLDLFTIQQELGSLDNFTIGIVGDLKYGRVVHSQCEYLAHFDGIRFIFVSPEALKMPEEIVELLQDKGAEVIETEDLESVVSEFDVFSQTRVQKERFPTEEEYLKHKGVYIVTPDLMAKAKDDMILIHPLPRIDEIVVSVDSDHRAKYFKQVSNGVAVRMALIANLLKL